MSARVKKVKWRDHAKKKLYRKTDEKHGSGRNGQERTCVK